MIMPDGTRLDLAQKSGDWCRECFGTGSRPRSGRWAKEPPRPCAGCRGTGSQSPRYSGAAKADDTAPCDVDYNV